MPALQGKYTEFVAISGGSHDQLLQLLRDSGPSEAISLRLITGNFCVTCRDSVPRSLSINVSDVADEY
jgi:hypothetical protein